MTLDTKAHNTNPLDVRLSEDDRSLRSYVVRNGRLSEHQKAALLALYPRFGCTYHPGHNLDSVSLAGREAPFVVEIGFGMGTATAAIAASLPETVFLGLEVHAPGVGKLLSLIGEQGLENLWLCRHDAMEVVETMLAPGSVDGFHIFFPDPWPKKRHHKRRIIRPAFVALLASRLKPDGYIYFVTDWEEYAESVLEVFRTEPLLTNRHELWAKRESWRPVTKFEQRAINDGRVIRELLFVRQN
ncbi:MAG: tRNA (guanosine(46)-N7)-methyltransferase TrmB [Spirochaetes bacterium GWD1_61_31]|nr:MAG: tRNA (guanosine(46)-N7)-methyltransferase TrmB [Spirochaetes bacterium GWB1_60_80]OHD29641.1 MAG: tRNA (guanosine(46)-N7)-methyltransferase TrmB [Spirochaetes bacterium GWC1_61_12]OHD37546.1 MAG: tRNA (guanosine(46)-N7)-methyltransferase TrmB [Spirochaetes bacterium GWD1_61_31]OHD41944.1 MAG: tRNA (guanosine(46)-N7)-methyltransferase TrmB [Spirochaetes bacterium GWE1_60_18]OHD61789.1 MAG: tRNA (guanosine(46)-N7)-methyltransferase TrmB [Spirochaetes bacterium GWF1_60_12]